MNTCYGQGQGQGQGQEDEGEDEDDWVPDAQTVPFGPFLALGALEYLFFGPEFVNWYIVTIWGIGP